MTGSNRGFKFLSSVVVGVVALVGASLLTLGPVVETAGTSTVVVLAVGAITFLLAVLTYAEGGTLLGRGGSATFARYGFDELVSFTAAWALLLDSILLAAAAAKASSMPLRALLDTDFGRVGAALVTTTIILLVCVATVRNKSALTVNRLKAILAFDLAVLIALAVAAAIKDGSVAVSSDAVGGLSVRGLLLGAGAAAVATISLEATFGAEDPIQLTRGRVRALLFVFAVPVLFLFSVLGEAMVRAGAANGDAKTYSYTEYPLLQLAKHLDGDAKILQILAALVVLMTLAVLVSSAISGATRIALELATHRQLPTRFGRLHETYETPAGFIVTVSLLALAVALLVPLKQILVLIAFGVTFALVIGHLSLVKLRWQKYEQLSPYGYMTPGVITVGNHQLTLLPLLGALLSAVLWFAVIIWHSDARYAGLGWMLIGVCGYIVYRKRRGIPIRRTVAVPKSALVASRRSSAQFKSILVPLLGSWLDDDAMQTAGRMAGGSDDSEVDHTDSVIQAVWTHVMPMSLALDGPISDADRDQSKRVLARSKAVGEEYSGVTVYTSAVRARALGRGIVDEASRRGCDAIVMVALPSVTARLSGAKLGARGGRGDTLSATARYVIKHAPCQVILTAPSFTEADELQQQASETKRRVNAANAYSESDTVDDDEEWLQSL